ncbi:MAG TPA: acyltransferase, partial [Longilinea sp.]|nr:acyltransferase [Longilinea sp.]
MGRQFQLLRGFAILLVLLNHTITMSFWMADRYGYPIPVGAEYVIFDILRTIGLFSVPLFLFLSGAFFTFAIQNRSLSGSYKLVWHDLGNILWPYIIWSIVFYGMVFFLLGEKYSFLGYIKNLIVGYPNNFVPVLILFYLLAPILVRIAKRQPVLLLVVIFAYQLFLTNVLQPGVLGFTFPAWAKYLAPPIVRDTLSTWAIFFPFGMVYNQYLVVWNKSLHKYALILWVSLFALFSLAVLSNLGILNFVVSGILVPIMGMMLIPAIRRDIVPFYRWMEDVGKRAYGLYLTNLIVVTLLLFGIRAIFPWLLQQYLLLIPILFLLVLFIPLI